MRYSVSVGRLVFSRVLAVALSLAARALAQEEPPPGAERVQIVHQASSGCPGSAAFHNEVMARVRRPVEWVQDGATTFIRVEVALSLGSATGSLEMAQASGSPARREFAAETCAEVSSALALVVALALDPNARTEPLVAEPAPPLPAPPEARDSGPAPQSTVRASPPPARFYFGPVAGAAGGYVPTGLVTVGAMLGVRSTRKDWFSPLVQLTPLWAKTGTTGPESSGATFAWTLLRLDACPAHLKLSSLFAIIPCVSGEGGRVSAQGRSDSVDVPDSAARPWAALGPSLGVRFNPKPWFAALSGSALAPFTRDKFVFLDPQVPIHDVPAVVFGGLLGVGVEL